VVTVADSHLLAKDVKVRARQGQGKAKYLHSLEEEKVEDEDGEQGPQEQQHAVEGDGRAEDLECGVGVVQLCDVDPRESGVDCDVEEEDGRLKEEQVLAVGLPRREARRLLLSGKVAMARWAKCPC
jgi:hypothetical protein